MEEQEKMQAIYNQVRLRVLKNADVIGVTTTGAAKNLSLLSALGAQIVICEEAAEVMESHLPQPSNSSPAYLLRARLADARCSLLHQVRSEERLLPDTSD